MNAHQLSQNFAHCPRIFHAEVDRPHHGAYVYDSDDLTMYYGDVYRIWRLNKMYPQATVEKMDPIKVRTKGFRLKLKSRIPEIRELLAKGFMIGEVADKMGLSETTIRRVDRYLRGDPSHEKMAVAVIGTHKLTGEVVEFPSMSQAENFGGFQSSKIGLCLTGRASHHKGYLWRRA